MSDGILHPALFARDKRVVAGMTTRAFSAADEVLAAARARLAGALGMGVASVGQVHRADVVVVREPGHVDAHDGLVTDVPGLLLTVVSADCALVLLADSEAGVCGACHSGWRGTVGGVLERTVSTMEELGARADRMIAYVAPCISTEAFEVGEEVAAQFDDSVVVRRPGWPRPHVDLRAELGRQLDALGVLPARREVAKACTVADPTLYSYRASGGAAGRMIGYVGLRKASAATEGEPE